MLPQRRTTAGFGAGVHRQLAFAGIFILLLCLFLERSAVLVAAQRHQVRYDGFENTLIANIAKPTDITFTPGRELLLTTKDGKVYVIEDPEGGLDNRPREILDLTDKYGSLCENGSRGLLGIQLHPDFASGTRYVYLYYTHKKSGNCKENKRDAPVNRLVRFQWPSNNRKIPLNSEEILFETPPLNRDFHNSGSMFEGKDGKLWITVGDGGYGSRTETPQGKWWSQDPDNILGKILRLEWDGKPAKDNPYMSDSDSTRCHEIGKVPRGSRAKKCQEVFAMGLRSPFRFSQDPNSRKVRCYVNDVGLSTWEEISECGADFPLVDYGWPIREGPCLNSKTRGCRPDNRFKDPLHWSLHTKDGGAVTASAFFPNELDWPSSFKNSYLYGNYVDGRIYRLKEGGRGCRNCNPPRSDQEETTFVIAPDVVTMKFGPYKGTQALYYVYGTRQEDSGLRRIVYTRNANRAPTAEIEVDSTVIARRSTVSFDGRGSTDPDGDSLTYQWDFGDGSNRESGSRVTHRYRRAGRYTATLTVSDGQGGENSASVEIHVGNNPPEPVIVRPAEGTTYAVGDVLTLEGYATDEDDGGRLDDVSLSWEVRKNHLNHFHDFFGPGVVGNKLKIQEAPGPEDFYSTTNSNLEIFLTATDSQGLSATVSRIVMPKTVELHFESEPSGLEIFVDSEILVTPVTVISWEKYTYVVEAPHQRYRGDTYEWKSWADGKGQSHQIVVPSANAGVNARTFVARFEKTTPTGRGNDLVFRATDATYVQVTRPNKNFSYNGVIKVDADARRDGLLCFEVTGINGQSVASVALHIYVRKKSNFGGIIYKLNQKFDAKSVTWETAPEIPSNGKALGQIGGVASSTWISVDLDKDLIRGNGDVCIRIVSSSKRMVVYEGTNAELIVSTG